MFRKILSSFLFLIFLLHTAHAQDMKIFRTMFREAEAILLYLNEDRTALEMFLELDRMDPGNAHINYKIGLCYLHIQGEKDKAIPYLLKATKSVSRDFVPTYKERNAPPDALFYLALSYHVNNQLDEAIVAYNDFIEQADINSYYNIDYVREQINGCLLAKEMMDNPLPVKEVQLTEQINLGTININSAVSGDGNTMVYTTEGEMGYQIFYATRNGNSWGNPYDITDEINAQGDGISSSLSKDGKTLFVFRDNNGAGDLFVTYLENDRWSRLEPLNRNINTKYWENSCCLSPDGNTLIFSSNRKGGYGKLDLYRSEKNEEGEWGPAKNLGPVVNTPLMEDHPQLTIDGNMLFFSSQGHNSFGGFDYYYSEKGKKSGWSLPVNLGYPISTTDDDQFMAPVGKGDTVYYSHYTKDIPSKKSNKRKRSRIL